MTEDKDEMVQRLSAADIFKVLKKQNPAAMRGVNPNAFAPTVSSFRVSPLAESLR